MKIGIDSNTLMVARRLPRKSRIISAVKIRPIVPSLDHVMNGKLYETPIGRRRHLSVEQMECVQQVGDGTPHSIDDADCV